MSSKETKEEKTSADNAPVSHEKAETKGLKTAPAEKLRWKVIRFLMYFVMFFFLIAGRTAEWALDEWGDLTLDEIMFTLTQPLKGTDSGIIINYLLYAVLPALLILLAAAYIRRFVLNGRRMTEKQTGRAFALLRRWFLPVCMIAAVLFGVFQIHRFWIRMGISSHINSLGEQSTYIEDNYVDPAKTTLTFPEKKRNLIYIFLESVEVSYADKESGGLFDENYIPKLTALSKENENFSGSDSSVLNGGNSLKYCTWTMGGMWAATSGLPLKIPIEINGVGTNFMNTQDSFFTNLTCLGDILQAQGYQMDMCFGSDATFGGRRLCFTEHGKYNFHDWVYYTGEGGKLPSDYKVWWGFEDEKLFEYAKERLTDLASGGEPFDFTLLTVDTHYPEGYVCRLCGDEYSSQYANVIACSDTQVTEFLDWCREQDWYENTTIVLSGDHPTMNKEFCADAAFDYRRKVYTCYLNSAVEPVRDDFREYATIDNFPTTLAAMGVKIEGDRLGLGTNLFSDQDTLVERDGLDYVNTELQKASAWRDEQSDLKEVKADIKYGNYDPETQTIKVTLSNVTSDQVDGFRTSLHMYGYTVNGSDYVSWTNSEEVKPGVHVVTIHIPTQKAFDGRIKVQPHCLIDGVRGIHLSTHYWYLKYDAGGGNAESYQCNKYGEKLPEPTFSDKVKDWFEGLFHK